MCGNKGTEGSKGCLTFSIIETATNQPTEKFGKKQKAVIGQTLAI